MDGPYFLAYVEQILAPTLKKGHWGVLVLAVFVGNVALAIHPGDRPRPQKPAEFSPCRLTPITLPGMHPGSYNFPT
jgi:hypothetical protein